MRSLLAFIALVAGIGSAAAGGFGAADHLSDCAGGADKTCLFERRVLAEQWPKALAGHYPSQRNVAFCLANGCYGAVGVDPVMACAWRTVILASGAPEIEQSDRDNYVADCRKALSAGDLAMAKAMAWRLYIAVYGREPDAALPVPPAR